MIRSPAVVLRASALLIGLAACSSRGLADSYRPKVGRYHPEIVLPTLEHDRAVALSDYRGKKVLLVHFASW